MINFIFSFSSSLNLFLHIITVLRKVTDEELANRSVEDLYNAISAVTRSVFAVVTHLVVFNDRQRVQRPPFNLTYESPEGTWGFS